MSQLLVRDLEEEVVTALKQAAAAHGHSAEAEHREILRRHLLSRPRKRPFSEVLAEMPYFGDDDVFDVR